MQKVIKDTLCETLDLALVERVHARDGLDDHHMTIMTLVMLVMDNNNFHAVTMTTVMKILIAVT